MSEGPKATPPSLTHHVEWKQPSRTLTVARLREVVEELAALVPADLELSISAGDDQRDRSEWLAIRGSW